MTQLRLPSPYSKPGPYITKLSPEDENRFQFWVKNNNIPLEDDGPTSSYDMRAYWRSMLNGDPNATQAANGHFPDTYKTPYHPTFSNESIYATPDAPAWNGDRLIDKTGNVISDESPVSTSSPVQPPTATVPSVGIGSMLTSMGRMKP